MTISTNYNASALTLQRNLSDATSALSKALERMSTGFKVNSAADDAAGLYVATRMNTQIRGLRQAQKNIQDGLSLLNTATGAIGSMTFILNRLRDLSVQAANNVYTDEQRAVMQKEVEELTKQYEQIRKGTAFNGRYLFTRDSQATSAFSLSNASYKIAGSQARATDIVSPPAPPPAASDPSESEISENQEGYNDKKILEELNAGNTPGLRLTGDEMNSLKYWLEAGETYEDFSASITKGMSADEILKTKGIEKPEFEIMPLVEKASGTVDFTAYQTKVVTLDGINYTIKNGRNTSQSLIWSKDDTGKMSFTGSNFDITLQSDIEHIVDLNGSSSSITGGNKDDKITVVNGDSNRIYSGAGNDIIEVRTGVVNKVYLESGNNTVHANATCFVSGGNGNDIINLNYDGQYNGAVFTGSGKTTMNFANAANRWRITTGSGENIFNILGTSINNLVLNGSSGTNTINNTLNNVQNNNIIVGNFTINGADKFVRAQVIEFNAKEEKTVTLMDGKRYKIKNEQNNVNSFMMKMSGDRLTTINAMDYTITAYEKTKIEIMGSYNTYYCSSFGDDVKGTATIYTGLGNNTISANGKIYCQGGDNNITVQNADIYADKGNNTITIQSGRANVFGGSGNNTYNIVGNDVSVYGGSGNDRFIIKSGVKNVSCFGAGGTNTIEGDISGVKFLSEISNAINNATSVLVPDAGKTNVNIDGSNYTIESKDGKQKYMAYSVSVDGIVSVLGANLNVTAGSSKYNKVDLYLNNSSFYGGDAGNLITAIYTNDVTIYGGTSDDTLINNSRGAAATSFDTTKGGNNTIIANTATNIVNTGNSNNKIIVNAVVSNLNSSNGKNHYVVNIDNFKITNGGNGDNIYEINGNNCDITAGTGNDTFIVNGDNNKTFGAAGDDYFAISSGKNNTVIGGSGENYMVDNAINTQNPTGDVKVDPYSSELYFTDNTTPQTITIRGKSYTITNTTTEGVLLPTNRLKYYYNRNTGEMTFIGNNFSIKADDANNHNINVKGSNNVVEGGLGNDSITVTEGTGNKLAGGDGNDILTTDTAGNKLVGGSGNDIFNVNKDNTYVDATAGDNTINVKSSNNTIRGGSGNDSININGNNNNIDGDSGRDTIIAVGDSNVITSTSGTNSLILKGKNNTIKETGNTNNTIAIEGEGNIAELGNGNNIVKIVTANTNVVGNKVVVGNGNNDFTINGNLNEIKSGSGSDSISIKGNNNKIDSGDGKNNIDIGYGSDNNIKAGSGEDKVNIRSDKNIVETGNGNDKIIISGNLNNVSSTGGNNDFNITGSQNTAQGGKDVDNFVISGNKNTAKGGDENDNFTIRKNAEDNFIDGEAGARNTMMNFGTNTTYQNVVDITKESIDFRLQVGANGDELSQITVKTDFYIDDLTIDLSSASASADSITSIDNALAVLNSKMSEFGAVMNRLESVTESNNTTIINLTASKSTIMDADIAQESAEYVRNQILQNTTSSLLKLSLKSQASIINNLLNA